MLYLACVTLPSSLLGCLLRLLYCTVLSQHHLLHHCMYHVLNKLCEAMLLVFACASSHGAKGHVSCSSQLSHLQAPYPDPKDAQAWNKQSMWPAALGSASNLSYNQQYKALTEVMKHLGISTVKVTHTWRVAGAQAMDAAGVDDSVSFWPKLSCEH